MTKVTELADFVNSRKWEDLSASSQRELKIRTLDALGCAFGALNGPPVSAIVRLVVEFDGGNNQLSCTLIGRSGSKSAPDRATLHNGALVRYLDFNDSFLAKGETCHPSDNVAPVLSAAEYSDASGKEFLLSLGIAYEVQCRLSTVAPVRNKGFDHVTQGAYAVAAGASKALGMDAQKTANAIAISGTALNALRVTRTGKLSNWKGLAYPYMASCAVTAVFLAREGITGPMEVFEGNKGFMDAISGPFEVDWSKEKLNLVEQTILKKYNAEIHSQSAIDCMLRLRARGLKAEEVDSAEVKIFDVAFNIIGGGEEGEKKQIRTKEEADHSLPYILAVALIDGMVGPDQYSAERITVDDVQTLLRKINIRPDPESSAQFPATVPCEITVITKNGRTLKEKTVDYEGFVTRPTTWKTAGEKFSSLASSCVAPDLQKLIIEAVSDLDKIRIQELTSLLGKVRI
jgi:2-methylcitrate dehydratase